MGFLCTSLSNTHIGRAAFDAASHGFDHKRWMWSFDPDGDGAPAYQRRGAPSDAKGVLAV
jgi:hypothetical protein